MDQPNLPRRRCSICWHGNGSRPAAIAGLAFNNDQSAVAFVGDDGSLAIAAMADPEPPVKRVRTSTENGRARIRPREKPVRPSVVVAPVDDRAPPIAAHRQRELRRRGPMTAGCWRSRRAARSSRSRCVWPTRDGHRRPCRHRSHRLRRRRRRRGLSRRRHRPSPMAAPCACHHRPGLLARRRQPRRHARGRRLPLAPRWRSGSARARLRRRTRRGDLEPRRRMARLPARRRGLPAPPSCRRLGRRRPGLSHADALARLEPSPPTPSSPPVPTAPPPGRWPSRRWRTPPPVPCRPAAPAWSWSSAWRLHPTAT